MNIFGKTVHDYQFLADAQKKNKALYDQLIRRGFTGKGHNFNALGNTAGLVKDAKGFRDDPAQGVTWLSYNIEAMQAEIEEIMYGEFRLPDYFPMNTNIPEGAAAYYYRVVNRQGQGTFIENFGTDAPTANVTAQRVPYQMKRGGIIPQWSDEDLREAIFGGIPLDTEELRAGTEGSMEHIEQVGLGTDPSGYFEGLLNIGNVTISTATTPWNSLTPDQIVSAIQAPIATLIANTSEIFGRNINTALALYVSIEVADLITDTPRATFSDKTIWDFVAVNNLWTRYTGKPLQLKIVQELSTAGVGGTNRVLYGYPDESRVWEMGMSISPRVSFIDRRPYYYQAPMEYKISGLNVKRPGGMLYVDDVYVVAP